MTHEWRMAQSYRELLHCSWRLETVITVPIYLCHVYSALASLVVQEYCSQRLVTIWDKCVETWIYLIQFGEEKMRNEYNILLKSG